MIWNDWRTWATPGDRSGSLFAGQRARSSLPALIAVAISAGVVPSAGTTVSVRKRIAATGVAGGDGGEIGAI